MVVPGGGFGSNGGQKYNGSEVGWTPGGSTYGTALGVEYFGSAGGRGRADSGNGNGGSGGGRISLSGNNLNISGKITSNGLGGKSSTQYPGGGGSGGGIRIGGNTITVGGIISAAGGGGGVGCSGSYVGDTTGFPGLDGVGGKGSGYTYNSTYYDGWVGGQPGIAGNGGSEATSTGYAGGNSAGGAGRYCSSYRQGAGAGTGRIAIIYGSYNGVNDRGAANYYGPTGSEVTGPYAYYYKSVAQYTTSGTYTSPIRTITSPKLFGNFRWSEFIKTGTGITFEFRSGDQSNLSDGVWTPVTNNSSLSGFNNKNYYQYRVNFTSDGNLSAIVDDISVEKISISDSITLDTQPPGLPADLKVYDDNTKQTEYNPANWYNDSSVYYEWTLDNEPGLTYKYCIGTNTCDPTLTPSGASSHTADLSALSDGTKYFRLIAVDAATNSSQIASVVYNIDKTVPEAVTGFNATENDPDKVSLTWNAVNLGSPLDHYLIERILYSDYPGEGDWSLETSYTTIQKTTNSHDDIPPAILPSTRYAYRIKVKDVANPSYSPVSAMVTGMTQDVEEPMDVTGVNAVSCDGTLGTCDATDGSGNPNTKGFSIKLTWTPAIDAGSGVAGYKIYRTLTPNVVESYVLVGNVPGTTFYDNDGVHSLEPEKRLNDFTTYYYRVTAYDQGNYESNLLPANPSQNADSDSTPDVTSPSIPLDVAANPLGIDSSGNKQKVQITWSASTDIKARSAEAGSGVTNYKIYQATDIDGPYNLIQTVNSSTIDYVKEGLDDYTYYYYKVAATDLSGNPADPTTRLSDPGTVRTSSSEVPTVPTDITVTAQKGNPATDATIGHKITVNFTGSYSQNFLVDTYELYRSNTNYSSENEWLTEATKVHTFNITPKQDDRNTNPPYSYIDTTLTDASTYFYRIRAKHTNPDAIWSPLSGITAGTPVTGGWDTTPDDVAPELPAELKVKDIHDDGTNFKRNIITWKRIVNPSRNGTNDFKEYRIYRSNDGLSWSQILVEGNNPLYNANQELAMANNYYMDLIPNAQANQYYYYYVTSADNAGTDYKYANNNVINPNFSNESAPVRDAENNIVSVSLNPAIAQPSITTLPSGKKAAVSNVYVSSAVVSWTTDQSCDSLVEFRKAGSNDAYIAIGDRNMRTSHTVRIFDLDPNTTYEYRVISRNSLANEDTAEGSEVPTLHTNGFNITTGQVVTTTSTAEINWSTNLNASSAFVEYQLNKQPGDEPQSGTAGVSLEQLSRDAKNHQVIIKGLRSNRAYTYKIKSISTDGFIAETSFLNFRTRAFDSAQFTLAPSSANVAERNITATTAQIIWQTGNETTSWVDFGTKSGVYDFSAGNNDMVTQHVVVLEGLIPGNVYYYRVRVKDANEVEYTSQEYSFRAVLKPKISNLQVSDVTPYSITIQWETNVETETILNWGTTTAYGEKRGKNEMTKMHRLEIADLMDNTEYHYQILAKDELGNEVADDDKVIRTPIDKEGPKITDVQTDILPMGGEEETATVVISWKTNKPATTQVQYDEGLIGNQLDQASTLDSTLNNSHTVIIRDLTPSATYRFRLVSTDKRGNTTITNDYNLVTPSKEKSILQLIVKSLEETFAWVKNIGKFFRGLGKKV